MSIDQVAADNTAQIDYWNTAAGPTWAELQTQLDRQLAPLSAAVLRALAPQPGEMILDIGCGCGDTTLALAEAVEPSGSVLGVDVSEPMLDVARRRATAPTLRFELADAQTADLGAARFDAAFSRFGVMFFSDPVAAFANIRRALKSGSRLTFVCWRSPAQNPWMSAPLEAARPLLPPQPPSDPYAPGPFAFADGERVRNILSGAGFGAIQIDPFDTMIGSGDLEQTLAMAGRVGPLARLLRENPDRAAPALRVVRDALAAYVTAEGVMMPAAVWLVSANA